MTRTAIAEPPTYALAEVPARTSAASARPMATGPLVSQRVISIDAFRGFVMFLMLAEVLRVPELAAHFPQSAVWRWLGFNTEHVAWTGFSLHDLIQPSFSFLVGAALPFSIASRRAKGQPMWRMALHACWRAALLIVLGIFLRSQYSARTNFTFEDTLTQIGLGYVFLFLLGWARPWTQWIVLALILLAYWGAWAIYPLDKNFDYPAAGVPADWPHHLTGFAAHWNKANNLGAHFDRWFLNLFPRPKPFVANPGGYLTLSFIPTLGTMIFGLFAGTWLQSAGSGWKKLAMLLAAGVALTGIGYGLSLLGVCPIVKRIWTPTWTIFSAGLAFLFLGGFYALTDLPRLRGWAFPLLVIGMNSIAAYLIAHFLRGFIKGSITIHAGPHPFAFAGPIWAPFVEGAVTLAIYWLVLLWMYRNRIFLRI